MTHEVAVTNSEFNFGPNYVPIYLNIGKHGHQHIWAVSKVRNMADEQLGGNYNCLFEY